MTSNKFRKSARRSERGNVFFTLFGAVAIVGVLGAGIMATMRGPLSTMVNVNRRTQAEADMSIASKLVLLEAVDTLANGGDCDGDNMVEPMEYETGTPAPAGGGHIPSTIGANKIDPWGTPYGYCAWDAGQIIPSDNIVACGGSGANRLPGNDSDDEDYMVMAVISAGANQTFETTCAGGANPDNYITKAPGSDDFTATYTYATAVAASGGLWKLKSGDPDTATIAKDIEAQGATFTGNVDLSTAPSAALKLGAASMFLPTQAEAPDTACDNPLEATDTANHGILRINTTTDPDTVEICDVGTTTWVSVAEGAAGVGLWKNDGPGGPGEIYYNAGLVGVGTNDPDDALDVVGVIGVTDNVEMSNTKSVVWASGASVTENTGNLEINANGGVGVEITVGATAVNIVRDTTITGSTADNTAAALNVRDSSAASLLFVRNDGNVGIGNTNPGDALSVTGYATVDNAYKIDGNVVLNTDGTNVPETILVGKDAGASLDMTTGGGVGDGNTVVGASSATALTTGTYNVLLGQGVAPTLETGDYNILIGANDNTPIDVPNANSEYYLNIGNLIYGDLSNKRIGINTGVAVLDDALEVNGSIDASNDINADDDITAGDDITAVGTVSAGVFHLDGITQEFSAIADCDDATDKITWSAGTGWVCATDLQGGSGGDGQNLEEVLVVGDDAGGENAVGFGGVAIGSSTLSTGGSQNLVLDATGAIGADYFCDASGNSCFTAATAGAGGTAKLNAITAADGANTINNGTNAQIWNWQLTAAGTGFKFGENVASTGGSTNQYILRAETLAGSTAIPLLVNNLGNSTSFRVSDGDSTPFVVSSAGQVGIGIAAPGADLHIYASSSGNNILLQNAGNTATDISSVDIRRGGTTGIARVQFQTDTTSHISMGLRTTDTTNGLSIWDVDAASAVRMFINGTTGYIGIATTTISDGSGSGGQALLLDIEGPAGASYYCDQNGLNCFTASSVAGTGLWERSGTVIRTRTPAVYATDDFVFGAAQLANIAGTGDDARMFFDKSKAAFRAGGATSTQWDDASVGSYSVAMGGDSISSGLGSTAMGIASTASNDASTAMGDTTIASGYASTAMGSATLASGGTSTAMGNNTTASGNSGLAIGDGTTASGDYSAAMGGSTTASGAASVAMGGSTTASGSYSAAMGSNTTASGYVSVALGREVLAGSGTAADGNGDYSMALGLGEAAGVTFPRITGDSTFGIFMGDQQNVNITASNIMALLGGRLVLDPDTTSAANINVSTGVQQLELDVEGDIGAINYCDQDGNNCFTASGILTGVTPRLSSLTAALADNSINNGAWNQAWNWQLTAAETAFKFGENAASTGGSSDQYVLSAETLAASTAIPLFVNNLGNGRSFQVNDVAADASPFIIDASGNVSAGGNVSAAGDVTITGDDLFMATNTSGYLLVADGTNYNPVAMSGDVTINSTGVTAIGADKVTEAMLKAVDAAVDEECLSYETTTGDFEWQPCVAAATSPAAPDRSIQFNNAGAFGGDANLTWVSNELRVDNGSVFADVFYGFMDDVDTGMDYNLDSAGSLDFLVNGYHSLQLKIGSSPVNYMTLTGGAAGSPVVISTAGSSIDGDGLGLTIQTRAQTGTNVAGGGPINIIGGTGNLTRKGGPVNITAGTGGATGAGGLVTISGGSPGATSGNAGGVTVTGGNGAIGNGGAVSLTGGTGNISGNNNSGASLGLSGGAAAAPGTAILSGGNSYFEGPGADVSILGTAAYTDSGSGNFDGGSIFLETGAATGTGTDGSIVLRTHGGATVNLTLQTPGSSERSTAVFGGTSAITLPGGTNAQRPDTGVAGMFRYNSDATPSDKLEYYDAESASWVQLAGGSVSNALSAITAAAADNSINNGAWNQAWNWQLTAAETAFKFGENAASTGGASNQYILSAETLAVSTAIPLFVNNVGAGRSFQVNDASGDTTPFVIDAAGNVGVGTATPFSGWNNAPNPSGLVIQGDDPNLGFYDTGGERWYLSASTIGWSVINDSDNLTRLQIDNDGNVLIGTTTSTTGAALKVAGTDSIIVPIGTDAQRPTGAAGMFRYNTDPGTNDKLEYYDAESASWIQLLTTGGAGASYINDLLDAVTDYTTDHNMRLGTNTAMFSGAEGNLFIGESAGTAGTSNAADDNIGIGYQAMDALTTGAANTAVGVGALSANTSGTDNTAFGWRALYTNTSAGQNTAVGVAALSSNVSGWLQVAVGYGALSSNTDGYRNTAVGAEALMSNTDGQHNIAVGNGTLIGNTLGSRNIAIGGHALGWNLTNSENTAIGYEAMRYADDTASGTETFNTAVGAYALRGSTTASNNTGVYNTALGHSALIANTGGSANTAIGNYALGSNTDGYWNIAIGRNALGSNTDNSHNISIGAESLANSNGGERNTAIGTASGNLLNTGDYNIMLGYNAGDNITSGSTNIVIGYDIDAPVATGNSQLNIGDTIYGDLSTDRIAIGTATQTTGVQLKVAGTGAIMVPVGTDAQRPTGAAGMFRYNTTPATNDKLEYYDAESATWVQLATGNGGANYIDDLLDASTDYTSEAQNHMYLGQGAGGGTGNANYAWGLDALTSNTTGENNVAISAYALGSNLDGSNNIAIGSHAMIDNTGGDNNIAIGTNALNDNTTGTGNTAIGNTALSSNDDGAANTAVGDGSLSSNVSGYGNTATGSGSLDTNTTGVENAAFGANALDSNDTGVNNTAIGTNALATNVANNESTAVGYRAMYYADDTATGVVTYNTALGAYALRGSTTAADNTGTSNTALGHSTLTANTSGIGNVAVGASALASNTTGTNNVALGRVALVANTTGFSNTAIGDGALTSATGNLNTTLGYGAGDNITSGSSNIMIGASVDAPSATADNQLNIGDTIYGDLSTDRIAIGTATQTTGVQLKVAGTGAIMVPVGTDAQRPTGAAGMFRYNTTATPNDKLEYYDAEGAAWVQLGTGGATTPAAPTRSIQFNNAGAFGGDANFIYTATGDLIVGSPQMDDDGNAAHDVRMFFNKTKAAFRAGQAGDYYWDDAVVGTGSFAAGTNTIASGDESFAMGRFSTAGGGGAGVLGYGLSASGISSMGFGREVNVTGDYSMGLGLGNPATDNPSPAMPIISGASSLGIFMGDQEGINLAADNTMAILGGDFIVGSYQLDDTTTGDQDSRMFFDISKGALRAGNVDDTRWDDASVGDQSVALGLQSSAAGDYGFAAGTNASAAGEASFAGGSYAAANGDYSVALGASSAADGNYSVGIGYDADTSGAASVALGRNVVASGTSSFAFGLGTAATQPIVSGNNSFGIFMGDQSGVDVTSSNVMSVMGGSLLVGTVTPTTGANLKISGTGAIMVPIGTNAQRPTGAIGMVRVNSDATPNDKLEYYDAEGAAWVQVGSAGSGSGLFELSGGAVRTVDASAAWATSDFVFGSSQLADTGNAAHDARMFLDKSKGAFRAGLVQNTEWDDANVGNYSIALGRNNTASGDHSFAVSDVAWADGNFSIAIGATSQATGTSSAALGVGANAGVGGANLALGTYAAASGLRATALGYQAHVSGTSSVAISAGSTAGTPPVVSGDSSLGIFMGDQDSVDLAADNTMAILGGDFIVGSYQLDDTTTGDQDSRMFFDKSKGAFRAGSVPGTQWDDANVGDGSVAFGGARAVGHYSFAMGENGATVAMGYGGVALGAGVRADNSYAIALGSGVEVYGAHSVALGTNVNLSGDDSLAFGLVGTPTGTIPELSGTKSIGFFMGDQSGIDLAANNTMGVFGGKMIIDPAVPATQLTARGVLDLGAATDALVLPRGTTAQQPGTPAGGMIRYNTTATPNDKVEYYDAEGGAWVQVGSGGSGGANYITDLLDAMTSYATDNNMMLGHEGASITATSGLRNLGIGRTAGDSITTGDDNIALGSNALTANTIGSRNVAIGTSALVSNVDGENNTAVGSDSLQANTGSYNTAVGTNTLYSNIDGVVNTAVGHNAMAGNTSGERNTAVGGTSLAENISGFYNSAVGESALRFNVTGDNNTALGWAALSTNNDNNESTALGYSAMRYANDDATGTETYNTAVGAYALRGSTTAADNTGTSNTALGHSALLNDTSGESNTAVGHNALTTNVTGSYNTSIGYNAMRFNDTGASNVAVGRSSLYSNESGGYNIAIGEDALGANTDGSGSIAIGHTALVGVVAGGTQNIGIGYGAGDNITTGDLNIIIGYDINAPVATGNSQLNIGDTIYGDLATDRIAIGTATQTTGVQLKVAGTGAIMVPVGTDAQRPTGAIGMVRVNNDATPNDKLEYYDAEGAAWVQVGSGGSGATTIDGLSDAVTDYTTDHNMRLGSNTAMFSGAEGNLFIGESSGNPGTSNAMDYNVGVGYQALDALTTGDHNTAAGVAALNANTTGAYNTAFGTTALQTNVAGFGNAAFGAGALATNTSDYNVGIGWAALQLNNTGDRNTAVGTSALRMNSGGVNNVAMGNNALTTNVGNSENTAIGFEAMRYADDTATGAVTYNTAVGAYALRGSTTASDNTGTNNTAIGHSAMMNATTGTNSVAVGTSALALNQGSNNIAVGHLAMGNANGGDYNTAIGASALYEISAGGGNVAVGAGALEAATGNTASNNTAIGTSSMVANIGGGENTAVGQLSLFANEGDSNTVLGWHAGDSLTGGDNNILIGHDIDAPTATTDSWLNIGDTIYGDLSTDQIAIGTATMTTGVQLKVAGTGAIMVPSGTDAQRPTGAAAMVRYNTTATPNDKLEYYDAESAAWVQLGSGGSGTPAGANTQIQFNNSGAFGASANLTWNGTKVAITGDIEYSGTITDTSDIRLKTDIHPLNKTDVIERLNKINTYSFRMKNDPKRQLEMGVMAQELEEIFPELVKTADDEMGTKSVNYIGLVAPLIEASKDLKSENDALKAQISEMKAQQDEMKQALSNISADIKGLKVHTGYGIGKAQMGLLLMLAALGTLSLLGIARRIRKAEKSRAD